ncbi:DsbA family protein [Oceanicella actignis]|uniref:Protein-disulfide isomerase n=1 Tax=Oceanicella actignis TaxID=1189325 RepID=A0A1M7TGJ7_9RHOB|nr:DsbA family protein [Oceanicella actignis]SET60181.1 Protein-disulfide isomerase [Oceanicella actignis]SHN69773.1 Protein-disulfide isomerase [Oceanicella actignis]
MPVFQTLRSLAAGALGALCAAAALLPAGPAAAQEMPPEERALLRAEVRRYLLEHPEVVMEALRTLEQRRREQAAQADGHLVRANADALFNDGYSYVAGNPEGDVTVVEFLDYNCGYCKRAHGEVKKLLETDPNVRLIIKEFPILGPGSTVAAQAALAALEQDGGSRYLAFSDALMRHRGALDEEAVWRIAEEVGLDVRRLRDDAASRRVRERVRANHDLARALRIEGTPTFVVGDQLVRGYVPLEQLRQRIEKARADKG